MSFLQPFLLVALAAAGIPLLLHLLSLRRLKVVPFSTLAFLKELQRSRIRALRLKQIILLLLRTLLVICIVLAFARPVSRGAIPAVGGEASTDIVILFDDSYSMLGSDDQGSFFRKGMTAARSILEGLSPDDKVLLVPYSRATVETSAEMTSWHSPVRADDEIGSIKPSSQTVQLAAALESVVPVLERRPSANKELYVISDFQAGVTRRPDKGTTDSPSKLRTFLLRLGNNEPVNAAPLGSSFASSIVEKGRQSSFDLAARNFSTEEGISVSASLFLAGDRMDQRVLQLQPGAEQKLSLNLIPRNPGLSSGSILFEGDAAEFDNSWSFVLRVPETRTVLLIATATEGSFLELALESSAGSRNSGIRVVRVPPDRVRISALTEFDAYIVCSPPMRDDVLDALLSATREGRGLILIPPVQPASFAAFQDFAAAAGVRYGPVETRSPDRGPATFGSTDFLHPLFSGMFAESLSREERQRRSSLESPDISRFIRLFPDDRSNTVVRLVDGSPFLLEQDLGKGRMLSYATAMTTEWSSLPVSGLFVPLIHRSVAFVCDVDVLRPNVLAGEEVVIPLPVGAVRSLRLTLPDKTELPVQPAVGSAGPVFRFRNTLLPGVYSLSADGREIDRFAVNLHSAESDTRVSEDERIIAASSILDPSVIHILEADEMLPEQLTEARIGSEFRTLLVVVALLTALAELLVASTSKKEQSPEPGT